jgi:hypothetical protein
MVGVTREETMRLRQLAHWVGGVLLVAGLFANGSATAQTGLVVPDSPATVLYDQTNNVAANQFVDSSDWGVHYPTLDSQAADDFVVPTSDIWRITAVTASGAIVESEGAGVLSLLVQFNTNSSGGLPASLLYSQTVSSGSISGILTGTLGVNLAPPLTLGPGHYWFSVQARQNCTSSFCKHWVWTERTVKSNLESVWQNPPNGIGSGCTTFKPRISVCHQPSASVNPDLLFKLSGDLIPITGHVYLPLVSR